MPYQLTYTGTLTVADNSVNADTLLILPGKDFVGYGSPVDQNALSALENFASVSVNEINARAIRGQLWFDVHSNTLKYNTSGIRGFPNWVTVPTSPAVVVVAVEDL